MSLIQEFTSLTETKILMLEVSKAKRKALLKKVAKYYLKERGVDELYRRTIRLIEDYPIVVERVYGEMDELLKEDPAFRERFFRKRFDMEEIWEDEYKDLTPEYQHERWWGLMALTGCVKLFKDLEKIDPTGNMKYGNWLIDVVLKYAIENEMFGRSGLKRNSPNRNLLSLQREKGRFYEDLPKLKAYLEAYHEMKKKNELPDDLKNIDQIQPAGESTSYSNPISILGKITKQYRAIGSGDYFEVVDQKLKEGKDYKLITKDANGYTMYEPLTQKARSVLGMATEWCTTYGEHCLNPDYQSRSPVQYDDLVILVDKSDPSNKIQMSLSSNQIMNEDDERIQADDFFLENQKVLGWILEIKPDEFNSWLNEDFNGQRFIQQLVGYDKHNELFEKLLGELGWVQPKNRSNDGVWILEYTPENPHVLTSSVEWMKDSFGGRAKELSVKEFVEKYLESSSRDIAEINRGRYKQQIDLSPRFAKAWIIHYNGIKDYPELEIYK